MVSRWNGAWWCPESSDLGIPLVTSRETEDVEGPIRDFIDSIPSSIREAVRPIEYCQLLVLRMLRASPEKLDLVLEVPALVLLVAAAVDRGVFNFEAGVEHLACTRKTILTALGCQGSNAAVKLVKRIDLERLNEETVALLMRVLSTPEALRLLGHCPRPSTAHLRVVLTFPELLHRGPGRVILLSSVTLGEAAYTKRLIEATRQLGDLNSTPAIGAVIRQCRNAASLRWNFDRLAARLQGRVPFATTIDLDVVLNLSFPPPPILGTTHIRPIRTPMELLHEGREMLHCLANEGGGISRGSFYLYRVYAPERATLRLITYGAPVEVEISGIWTYEGYSASQATWLAVENWLANASTEVPHRR